MWREEQAINIYEGRFSAAIGAGTKLNAGAASFRDVILDGEALFLSIEIEDAAIPGTFVALSGRQPLEATPYAAWSKSAPGFSVAGALDVGTSALITGSESSGVSSAGVLTLKNGSQVMVLDGNEIDSSAALALQSNSGDKTHVAGPLDVPGALTTSSTALLNGALSVTSTASMSGRLTASGGLTASSGLDISGGLAVSGADNNGSAAAFRVDTQGSTNRMRFDGNEIDATGALSLQSNSGDVTQVKGDLNVLGKIKGLTSYGSGGTSGDWDNFGSQNGLDKDDYLMEQQDGFCFLSGMRVRHRGGDTFPFTCRVLLKGNQWFLRANSLNADGHTNIGCWAHCVKTIPVP